MILAVEGIGVIMPVENSMEKPQHFLGKPSILLISMIIITVLYTVIGLLGYIRFGDKIRGSITLNLPTDEITAVIGQLLVAMAILFTFGLQFYVAIDILLKKLMDKVTQSKIIWEIVIRSTALIIMGGTAAAIPDLEPFISLVGALFFGSLGLLAPPVIETVFAQSFDGFGKYNWRLWKNIVLIIFSLIAIVAGVFTSIEGIINIYVRPQKTF